MAEQRNILIVEDSPTLAMAWRMQLEPGGYNIIVAEDGKAAYAILRAQPIDCMLLDLKFEFGRAAVAPKLEIGSGYVMRCANYLWL